jgi:hypothetical protein
MPSVHITLVDWIGSSIGALLIHADVLSRELSTWARKICRESYLEHSRHISLKPKKIKKKKKEIKRRGSQVSLNVVQT